MSELKLQQANRIIERVLELARERDMPPLAVAVLDAGAHPIAFQRADGVSFLRADIASAKAWGALAMNCNSADLAERYQKGELQKGFIDALNAMTGGRVVALPGGVLVRAEDGTVLGAVGAAGGESQDDENCVKTAIEAEGFHL